MFLPSIAFLILQSLRPIENGQLNLQLNLTEAKNRTAIVQLHTTLPITTVTVQLHDLPPSTVPKLDSWKPIAEGDRMVRRSAKRYIGL